jgi:5-methylcytosine-specific restriction endonuclease McrA
MRVFYFNCAVCDLLFVSRAENALYCSKGCSRQARSTERVGAIRNQVFARDGGMCQICGTKTNENDWSKKLGADGRMAFLAGPLYPTVDHITPQANGGEHEMSNLRTAHFRCNTERGVGVENEQLAWAV